jgi:hypothetical protein
MPTPVVCPRCGGANKTGPFVGPMLWERFPDGMGAMGDKEAA